MKELLNAPEEDTDKNKIDENRKMMESLKSNIGK